MRPVANLEEDAFRRDRSFLVRLAFALILAVISGLFMVGWLTGDSVAGCAARSYGGVAEPPPAAE